MQIFPNQFHQLVGILTWSRNPNRPRPIEIHMGQHVSQLLNGIWSQSVIPRLLQDHIVGRGDGAQVDVLWDQKEVLECKTGDAVVNDGSWHRILELRIFYGEQPGVDSLLDHNEVKARFVIGRSDFAQFLKF